MRSAWSFLLGLVLLLLHLELRMLLLPLKPLLLRFLLLLLLLFVDVELLMLSSSSCCCSFENMLIFDLPCQTQSVHAFKTVKSKKKNRRNWLLFINRILNHCVILAWHTLPFYVYSVCWINITKHSENIK